VEKTRRKASAPDAIEMLMEDHRNVQKLFKQFEKLKEDAGAENETKRELVERACGELSVHAQLEEELFYPAAQDALDEPELVEEAIVEHASAKELIARLESMAPGESFYDATFTVLAEYVNHHIKEEEKELFPKLKKAKMDVQALAEPMQQRKQELVEELGLTDSGETEEGKVEDEDKAMAAGEAENARGARPSRRSAASK
jgi:hemerythrin-like domain-containing protein